MRTRKQTLLLQISLWSGLCALLTVGLGCASSTVSNVAIGEVRVGEAGELLMQDYVVKDKALAKRIGVKEVKARYVNGLLEGQAVLYNKKKDTFAYEYKFEWYDETGIPIESNVTLWTPDLLYGKEQKWIRSLCPKAGARGFKIMIRAPHPVD